MGRRRQGGERVGRKGRLEWRGGGVVEWRESKSVWVIREKEHEQKEQERQQDVEEEGEEAEKKRRRERGGKRK